MGNLTYLFMAYTSIWVVLFLYIAGLYRAQRRLRKDMELLRELSRASEEEGQTVEVGPRSFQGS